MWSLIKSENVTPKKGNVFRLIDPINNGLMMEIKNPQIPIKPLDPNHKGINLVQALEAFNGKVPDFGYINDSVEYD